MNRKGRTTSLCVLLLYKAEWLKAKPRMTIQQAGRPTPTGTPWPLFPRPQPPGREGQPYRLPRLPTAQAFTSGPSSTDPHHLGDGPQALLAPKTAASLPPPSPPRLTWDGQVGKRVAAQRRRQGAHPVRVAVRHGSRRPLPPPPAALLTARRAHHRPAPLPPRSLTAPPGSPRPGRAVTVRGGRDGGHSGRPPPYVTGAGRTARLAMARPTAVTAASRPLAVPPAAPPLPTVWPTEQKPRLETPCGGGPASCGWGTTCAWL